MLYTFFPYTTQRSFFILNYQSVDKCNSQSFYTRTITLQLHLVAVRKNFFFLYIFMGFCVYVCTSAAPQRPAHGTVSSQVATHLRTDRVCRVLGRSRIWTQDYWFPVRCATIEPPLLLKKLGKILLLTLSVHVLFALTEWGCLGPYMQAIKKALKHLLLKFLLKILQNYKI